MDDILQRLSEDNRVVVVGSGPAGAVAALRLAESGVPVTVLEAGRRRDALGLTIRVAGVTVTRLHRTLRQRHDAPRTSGDSTAVLYEDLAPGGLTNHWSCAVPRFSREDFLDAKRAGEAYAWPVDYEDLVPAYEWVEPLLRISGADRDVPQLPAGRVTCRQALDGSWSRVAELAAGGGQGLTAVPYTYGRETTATLSGTVFNSFARLMPRARRSGNLTICFGAAVRQLEWSGAHRRVTGVIYRDQATGTDHRLGCRAVVVAAGAVNSAKLLLQSIDGDFPHGLGNTEGVLGRYLHDHPIAKLEVTVGTPLSFQPAAYLTRAPLERSEPLYAASCLQWTGTSKLLESVLRRDPGRSLSTGFNVFGTIAPSLANFVALDPARTGRDGTPGLALNIRYPLQAEGTLVAARDRLIELLGNAGLDPTVRGWVVDPVGSAVHYAGTCRMHASPKFGMLDAWSRLHAVKNVAVADSAAFTTGPEKNPVLTAMALAVRASDRLADDIRRGAI